MNPDSTSLFEATLADTLASAVRIRSPRAFAVSARSIPAPADDVCRDAIAEAISLRRIKTQYRQTGFRAVPLDTYLTLLSREAGVSLPDVAIDDSRDDPTSRLAPWLAVARRIDASAEHLRLWVRAWFAAQFAPLSVPALALARTRRSAPALRGVPGVNEDATPADASAALDRTEQDYPAQQRAALDRVLASLT